MKISQLFENKVLRTAKGTQVKRSRYGVGKDIGGMLYLHRNYDDVIPAQDALREAKDVLADQHPSFSYNVVRWDYRANKFTFVNSPDFDTADEPTTGNFITVDPDTGKTKSGKSSAIWHHKWLWVKDDYRGFDVQESFERSRLWLTIPDIQFNKIGNRSHWEQNYVPQINSLLKSKNRV